MPGKVHKGALYQYFLSKQELPSEVFRYFVEKAPEICTTDDRFLCSIDKLRSLIADFTEMRSVQSGMSTLQCRCRRSSSNWTSI